MKGEHPGNPFFDTSAGIPRGSIDRLLRGGRYGRPASSQAAACRVASGRFSSCRLGFRFQAVTARAAPRPLPRAGAQRAAQLRERLNPGTHRLWATHELAVKNAFTIEHPFENRVPNHHSRTVFSPRARLTAPPLRRERSSGGS